MGYRKIVFGLEILLDGFVEGVETRHECIQGLPKGAEFLGARPGVHGTEAIFQHDSWPNGAAEDPPEIEVTFQTIDWVRCRDCESHVGEKCGFMSIRPDGWLLVGASRASALKTPHGFGCVYGRRHSGVRVVPDGELWAVELDGRAYHLGLEDSAEALRLCQDLEMRLK